MHFPFNFIIHFRTSNVIETITAIPRTKSHNAGKAIDKNKSSLESKINNDKFPIKNDISKTYNE